MAALTGNTIASTYKDLLQVSNSNSGVDGTLRSVEDGEGTASVLQISSSAVKVGGTVDLDGAVTINESSADVDFRVESNDNTHMLFVDAGNNRVGIGTDSPSLQFVVNAADGKSDNAYVAYIGNQEATDDRSYGLQIVAGSTVNDAPLFIQDHDASNDLLILRGNGAMGIGTTAPAARLHVHSDDETNLYITTDADNRDTGLWFGHDYDGTAAYSGIVYDREPSYQLKIFNIKNEKFLQDMHHALQLPFLIIDPEREEFDQNMAFTNKQDKNSDSFIEDWKELLEKFDLVSCKVFEDNENGAEIYTPDHINLK